MSSFRVIFATAQMFFRAKRGLLAIEVPEKNKTEECSTAKL